MIFHYLKIAFRNLLKYRQQTIVSVVGLAVGFVCFALSAYWIRYELSFDNFHRDVDRIYQVRQLDRSKPFGVDYSTAAPLAPKLEEHFPALQVASAGNRRMNFDPGENQHNYDAIDINAGFFDLFDIELVHGAPLDMDNELGVWVTEEFARSYFKTDNPVGRMLPYYIMDKDIPWKLLTVKGVVKSWPRNTNMRFDVVLPISSEDLIDWNDYCQTYIKLDKQTDPEELNQKLQQLHLKGVVGEPCFTMVPLTEMYYTEPVYNDAELKFDQVLLFAILGLMIVICALFNYLNLYASRIRIRSKELSLRKVNGGSDRSLFALLISEFLLLLLMALFLGFVGIEWAMPTFQQYADIQSNAITIYAELLLYVGLIILISVSIAWAVVIYMRRQLFQQAIRNHSGHNQHWFTRSALVVQMVISLGFVFCTAVYFKQIHTLSHDDMSIAKENIVTLSLREKGGYGYSMKYTEVNVLLDGLKGEPSIAQLMPIGEGTVLPRMQYNHMQAKISETTTDEEALLYNSMPVPPQFIDFYELELIAGRNFQSGNIEVGNVIINQTAARKLGLGEDALGKEIFIQKQPFDFQGVVYADPLSRQTIIGVVKDFVFESPLNPVEPVILTCDANRFITIAMKSHPGQYDNMIAAITRVVKTAYPEKEPMVHNMEKVYQAEYEKESSLRFLLGLFSLVCVVISLFGIYAMVSLNSEHRRKEVAVRKVNGATLLSLFVLFSREYLYLLLISALISLPIGYFIMKRWCEKFVIQTSIGWWVFLLVFVVTALLIFATVVWRVWKTAHMNPSQELKKE